MAQYRFSAMQRCSSERYPRLKRIERLLRVVIAFQQGLGGQPAVGLRQVDQRLFGVRRRLGRHIGFAHPRHAKDVEYQHAVVCGDSAPAFRDDGGVRHFDFIAHVLHMIDDVVGVLLEGVVHAGFIGLGAVVVDSEAAAHVQVF